MADKNKVAAIDVASLMHDSMKLLRDKNIPYIFITTNKEAIIEGEDFEFSISANGNSEVIYNLYFNMMEQAPDIAEIIIQAVRDYQNQHLLPTAKA